MAGDVATPGDRRGDARALTARCLISGMAALVLSGAQIAEAAETASEPAIIAQRVWEKLLTRCGEDYFYGGSIFDSSGMLNDVQVGHQKTIEYRGVRFHDVPIRVTDAERANGIAYRARITMVAHLYREQGEQWQDGPDLQPRNVDDMFGQAIGQANSDMFDMGGAGAIALQIVKYKGIWAVERSSTTSSSEIGFGSKFYEVAKFLTARTPRYSCQASSVVAPPPTAAEVEAQRDAARKTAAARAAAETARRAQDARDNADKEKEEARAQYESSFRFQGGPEAFKQALAANFAKRSAEFGLDASAYQSDLETIDQIVTTCMGVTIKDWVKAESGYRIDVGYVGKIPGLNPLKGRAKILKRCDDWKIIGAERISSAGVKHGLAIGTRMTEHSDSAEGDLPRGNFFIQVRLLPEDDPSKGGSDTLNSTSGANVILAKIPLPDLPGNR